MFEATRGWTGAGLEGLVQSLGDVDSMVTNGERIWQLDVLERVKGAVAAAQARITARFVQEEELVAAEWRQRSREAMDAGDFDAWRAARDEARCHSLAGSGEQQEEEGAAAGGGSRGVGGRGEGGKRYRRRRRDRVCVDAQVALARRESPTQGSRHVRLALALVHEMPHTLAALQAGLLSEWRAGLVVRETQVLTCAQRREVDEELAVFLGAELAGLGDRELANRVRAVAYRIDAASVVARARAAEGDRRVTFRPAPDTMAYVTALLPAAQGVAVQAALTAAAASAKAAGDERSKGQVMADELVRRITGQIDAAAVPVEVNLVITDRALFAADATPAMIPGYGPIPAAWARELLVRGADDPTTAARIWLRRLYTHPGDGTLVAMDSSRRLFDGGIRRFVVARDGTCQTPWCDAPISHIDHVVDHASGGPTSAQNAQGACVRCNLAKQAAGYRARVLSTRAGPGEGDGHQRHSVELITPTGHSYRSLAPPVLDALVGEGDSVIEHHLMRHITPG